MQRLTSRGIFALVAAGLAGCALVAGLGDEPAAGPAVDGGRDASDASMQPDVDAAPAPDPIFVSSTASSDGNDGTQAAPVSTIPRALALLAQRPPGTEVHACRGTYALNATLTITSDVVLRGGYDCTTWVRPAVDGVPTNRAPLGDDTPPLADGTRIQLAPPGDAGADAGADADADAAAPTVVVELSGSRVTSSTILERVVIVGPTVDGALPSAALRVSDGAAPVILQNVILGGSDTQNDAGSQTGSYGIDVIDGANPDISLNYVHGGTGFTNSAMLAGSIGVRVNNAKANLHENTISGGQGQGGSLNTPVAGDVMGGSIGISLEASSTGVVLGNRVSAGKPVSTTADNSREAIHASHSGSLRISQNRIFTGTPQGTQHLVTAEFGVVIEEAADSVDIDDNLVLVAENTSGTAPVEIAGLYLMGSAAVVSNNTIVVGPSSQVSRVIRLSNGLPSTFENNLFVAANQYGTSTEAFHDNPDSSCASFVGLNVNNNVFVGIEKLLEGEGCPTQPVTALGPFESFISTKSGMDRMATGNFLYGGPTQCDASATCVRDPKCQGDAGNDCLGVLFLTFSPPVGLDDLNHGLGWQPNPNQCYVAQGGRDLRAANITQDVNGATRTVGAQGGSTIGAVDAPKNCPGP